MSAQINFLRQRRKKLTAQEELDKRYATIAGYITLGLFCIFILVAITEFFLNRSITSLKTQQRRVESLIVEQAEIEKEYLVLGDKLSLLQDLVEDKGLKQDALEFFSILFSNQDVALTQVVFSKENIIQFDIQTQDVFQYRALLSQLESAEVSAAYPQLSVTDLNRIKTGQYVSTVTIQIGEDEKENVPARKKVPLEIE